LKILLTGKNGQLGWELNRSLQPLGNVIALGRAEADFSRPEELRKIMREVKPDICVNAAAYTSVDKAEEEVAQARAVNEEAPGVLAEEAKRLNTLLVHYSTDYVFDGAKRGPYLETDDPSPVNEYGRSKLAGELAIKSSGVDYLIFRTSWVYAARGHNFLLSILKLAKKRDELRIIDDQIGTPTPARLIADTTALCLNKAIARDRSGRFMSDLYNLTAAGHTSWYGFAREIVSAANKREALAGSPVLTGIPAKDYPLPARRPMNSRLSLDKLQTRFNLLMPDWKKVMQLCLADVHK